MYINEFMAFSSKKIQKNCFFFEFFQIKMLLVSGLRVDRGNEVCNFEGNFISFKQEKKIFNPPFVVFKLLNKPLQENLKN